MASTETSSPVEKREQLRQRIVDAVRGELSEAEMYDKNFFDAMWLAMQSLCGPEEAAATIRNCQIHP